LWPLLALGLFVSQFLAAAPLQKDLEASVQDPEEYAVYSALLNARYASKGVQRLVIDDWTPSTKKNQFIGLIGGLTPTGAKRPEVPTEIAADFDEKNKDTFILKNRFSMKLPYVLVAESELREIFHLDSQGHLSQDPWHLFYEKYPGSRGIISLSRLGFNSTKDVALVYVANQSGLVSILLATFQDLYPRNRYLIPAEVPLFQRRQAVETIPLAHYRTRACR
jgi:hypothetical protein